jgi:hypothetical protein
MSVPPCQSVLSENLIRVGSRIAALASTAAFEQSRRYRKRVKMLFAHLNRILRLGRLRSRGPSGARDEFTLAAITRVTSGGLRPRYLSH